MKRPAIFFDRDNTLIASDGYLGDPAQVVLVRGAADAVARARQLGYAVVVFSNQSGVARGKFSEENVRAVNVRLDELLKTTNPDAIVERHEFCPYHPAATVEAYRRESDLRKPAPGMIYSAAQKLALDLSRSWVIGDAPRDIEAGHAAGCRTIQFRDNSLPVSPAAAEPLTVAPETTVATLREALDYIASAPPITNPDPSDASSQRMNGDEVDAEYEQDATNAFDPIDSDDDVESETDAGDARGDDEDSKPYVGRTGSDMRSVAVKLAGGPSSGSPSEPPPSPRPAVPPRPVGSDDPAPARIPTARLESFAEQILQEVRRQTELGQAEFSVSKLLGGIVQVMSVAVMFLAYLNRADPTSFQPMLLFAIWLQLLTVALLVMGRQK